VNHLVVISFFYLAMRKLTLAPFNSSIIANSFGDDTNIVPPYNRLFNFLNGQSPPFCVRKKIVGI